MSSSAEPKTEIYGMVAEFESPEELLEAAEATRKAGYRRIEGYSPFPIHGLDEAIGFKDSRIPWIIFIAGCFGAIGGFGLQYYVSVIDYPLNAGGRPLLSWPHFVPVTFESTVLCAAIAGVVSMFALNGLPRPHHPVFNTPGFLRASQDRFFLAIEFDDSLYDSTETRDFLQGLNPINVSEVESE